MIGRGSPRRKQEHDRAVANPVLTPDHYASLSIRNQDSACVQYEAPDGVPAGGIRLIHCHLHIL